MTRTRPATRRSTGAAFATILTTLTLAAGLLVGAASGASAAPVADSASTTSAATTTRTATTAPRARNYYGALALSTDSAFGYAFDKVNKRQAFRVALTRCRNKSAYPNTCTKVGWVRNGCGAVSVKYNSDGFVTKYKYGYGRTKNVAKRNARRNFGGQIRGWVCTTRP